MLNRFTSSLFGSTTGSQAQAAQQPAVTAPTNPGLGGATSHVPQILQTPITQRQVLSGSYLGGLTSYVSDWWTATPFQAVSQTLKYLESEVQDVHHQCQIFYAEKYDNRWVEMLEAINIFKEEVGSDKFLCDILLDNDRKYWDIHLPITSFHEACTKDPKNPHVFLDNALMMLQYLNDIRTALKSEIYKLVEDKLDEDCKKKWQNLDVLIPIKLRSLAILILLDKIKEAKNDTSKQFTNGLSQERNTQFGIEYEKYLISHLHLPLGIHFDYIESVQDEQTPEEIKFFFSTFLHILNNPISSELDRNFLQFMLIIIEREENVNNHSWLNGKTYNSLCFGFEDDEITEIWSLIRLCKNKLEKLLRINQQVSSLQNAHQEDPLAIHPLMPVHQPIIQREKDEVATSYFKRVAQKIEESPNAELLNELLILFDEFKSQNLEMTDIISIIASNLKNNKIDLQYKRDILGKIIKSFSSILNDTQNYPSYKKETLSIMSDTFDYLRRSYLNAIGDNLTFLNEARMTYLRSQS